MLIALSQRIFGGIDVWISLLGHLVALCSRCSSVTWRTNCSRSQSLVQPNRSDEPAGLHDLGHLSTFDRASDGTCNSLSGTAKDHFCESITEGKRTCTRGDTTLFLLGGLSGMQQGRGLVARPGWGNDDFQ